MSTAAAQLPFKLKNTGAVRPVTCDLKDYFYGDRDARQKQLSKYSIRSFSTREKFNTK